MSLSRLIEPRALDDLLLYRISRLLSIAGSPVIRLCEGRFGITRREWRVLALLAQEESLLSSELAVRAQLDRARTSRAITSLVGKELLLRQARPSDRRHATLTLTEAGRVLYEALFPLVLEINRALLACLPADEVAQIDAALDTLQRHADSQWLLSVLPKADRRRGGRLSRRMPISAIQDHGIDDKP